MCENGMKSTYIKPVKGVDVTVLMVVVNGVPFMDRKATLKAYEGVKGFYIPRECLRVFETIQKEDSAFQSCVADMVSIHAVIAAIYRSKIPVLRREEMCDYLLQAPAVEELVL
jgi:hypothetical protein